MHVIKYRWNLLYKMQRKEAEVLKVVWASPLSCGSWQLQYVGWRNQIKGALLLLGVFDKTQKNLDPLLVQASWILSNNILLDQFIPPGVDSALWT